MSTSGEKRSIGRHACERCRQSKTRCLLDTFEAHNKCRKCFTANLECTWKEISTTRRRKRTDLRVSQLENQIKNLETTLTKLSRDSTSEIDESYQHGPLGEDSQLVPPVATDGEHPNVAPGDREDRPASVYSSPLSPRPSSQIDPYASTTSYHRATDPLTELLTGTDLTRGRQGELVQDFIALLLPQYPIIALGPQETFDALSSSKPLLTSAVLTAASSISEPRLFEQLHTRMVRILVERALVQGEKSLELVQALLMCGVWYNPPSRIENLTFQLCNMAGTMALELGLGGRTSRQSNHQVVTAFKVNVSDAGIESFRTMFSVHLTCSRIAVSLRRQCMMSFNPATHDALKTFAEHAKSPNDKRLVAWVRLQLIAEHIERMKTTMEAREAKIGFSSDRETLKEDISFFVDRLSEWESATDSALLNESLQLDLRFCKCKLHELIIYADHNVEDLSITSISPAKQVTAAPVSTPELNPTYVRGLLSFVTDCQSIFDAVLATEVSVLRQCPLLTHMRIPYAFKALAMLQKMLKSPGKSNVKKVIDEETLKFGYYVGALSIHMEAASSHDLYSAPTAALRIRDLVARSSTQMTGRKAHKRHETQPHPSTTIENSEEAATQISEHRDDTGVVNESNNTFEVYDASMDYQFNELSVLPTMDDTNSFYFDWTPEFMNWS